MGLFPFFVGVVIAGEYTHWRSFWKFEMYQRGSYWYSCPRKVGNFWVQQTRGEEGVVMITLFFFLFVELFLFLFFWFPCWSTLNWISVYSLPFLIWYFDGLVFFFFCCWNVSSFLLLFSLDILSVLFGLWMDSF